MRVLKQASDTYEIRDAISHDWMHWALERKHVALPAPNLSADLEAFFDTTAPDVLILTGGNDFLPRPGYESDVSKARNKAERQMLDIALSQGLYVLGVCRGMHVINAYFGGSVTPDLRALSTESHVASVHQIRLRAPFDTLTGCASAEVNSFHNQCISAAQVAPSLRTVAEGTADGIVEAIIHETLPVLGIQWHPERPNPGAKLDQAIIERFLNEGAFWRSEND